MAINRKTPLQHSGACRVLKGFILLLVGLFLVSFYPSTLPAQGDYMIGSEDILEIIVWGHDDLKRITPVSLEGIISFPLIGEVRAEGLSAVSLEKVIASKLAEGYIVKPQVTVTVKEYKSQQVFLMGEVTKPGTYPVTRENDILYVLSQAGGPTKDAGEELVIIRPGKRTDRALTLEEAEMGKEQIIRANLRDVLAGNKKHNITIRDGDTLIVPKMPFFFVMGEVKTPGKYNLERGTTVLMGISIGGGLTQLAAPKRTKITREIEGKKIEIPTTMDTLVLPGDTIIVPESFF
jgi:polysaccharide export outer membrane protein